MKYCTRHSRGLVLAAIFTTASSTADANEAELATAATAVADVIVTGRRHPAYKANTAAAGTKIDAAIRDIPQSIQVLDRELLDDLAITRAADLIKNVSGVYREGVGTDDRFVFRGFTTSEFLRDGFPDRNRSFRDTAATERIEVLKGPASVLYGRLEPGGTLNYVSKRPQFEPDSSVDIKADSEGLWRSTVDVDTVTAGGELGVRVNGAYEHGENFRDFSFSDRHFGAAVMAWRPREGTSVSVEVEAMNDRRRLDPGLPQFGKWPAPVPVSRTTNEPDDEIFTQTRLIGYTVEHQLTAAWQLRHALRAGEFRTQQNEARAARSTTLIDGVPRNVLQETGDPRWDGVVGRQASVSDSEQEQLNVQAEAIGDIEIFSMRHQLLFGLDVDHFTKTQDSQRGAIVEANGINLYQPVYGNFEPVGLAPESLSDSEIRTNAFYAQDLIELAAQWKLLVGARFDDSRSQTDDLRRGTSASVEDDQLSPRAGIVWQPSDSLSLYTSYSEAFVPVIGQTFEGELFEPTLGKQVESGVKSEWLDGRLGATVAVFRIVKDNVSVSDPENTGFSIQTGQTTSDGVEFDLTGSPILGLRMVGNVSFADVRITKDTTAANIGRRPRNVPTRGGGLSVSYDLQGERWRGFGGRLGMHYVGERFGENSVSRPPFFLPSYTRWDAGFWYKAARWRLALNLENLFDKKYYVAVNNNLIYPGAPFGASISVGYDL